MKKINKHMRQIGDLKDRGRTKWQGMLLTEHVQMLREWKEEDNYTPKPKLDEYDMKLIQEEMDLALKRQCDIIIHTWNDGKIIKHDGAIVDINITSRILIYEDPFKQRTLNIDEIVSVNMID